MHVRYISHHNYINSPWLCQWENRRGVIVDFCNVNNSNNSQLIILVIVINSVMHAVEKKKVFIQDFVICFCLVQFSKTNTHFVESYNTCILTCICQLAWQQKYHPGNKTKNGKKQFSFHSHIRNFNVYSTHWEGLDL